jgi:hypothetical protein
MTGRRRSNQISTKPEPLDGRLLINRTRHASMGPFSLAMLVVLVLSVLPTSWLVPWTNRLSEITRLPLVPLGDVATSVRIWLTVDGSDLANREQFDLLETERNEYRRRFHAAAERVRELEGLVESLRGLPPTGEVGEFVAIEVDVVGGDPSNPASPLQVNAGTRRGILPGAVAVHRGDTLVGRVLADVGPTTAWVRPAVAFGLLDARLVDDRGGSAGTLGRDGVPVQLRPDGSGWTTTVDRSAMVEIGMVARLHDPGWSRFAQGLLIGVVREIRTLESNPTRRTIRIDVLNDPQRLDHFLVVSPKSDERGPS